MQITHCLCPFIRVNEKEAVSFLTCALTHLEKPLTALVDSNLSCPGVCVPPGERK